MSVVPIGEAIGSASLALLGIAALFNCNCKDSSNTSNVDDSAVKDSELDGAMAAADQAAKDAADKMAADAAERDAAALNVLDQGEKQLGSQADKIKAEMDAYNKQWGDAKQGVDPNSPDYATLKKQYDDYQDYLKGKLDDVNSQLADIQTTKLQEAAAQASKGEWVKQRQEDLIQTAEQKSFLEAVAKGYGAQKGYDIDDVNRRLAELNRRETELKGILKENNADINYTATQRDPIGPDADSIRLQNEYRDKKAALDKEIADARTARNDAHLAELKEEQKWLEKDMQNQASKAAFWNAATKGAEAVQVGADIGVDILSNVTGPAGKYIKAVYQVGKGFGGGVGEGLASGDDMGANILKGTVGGVSDVIKDKIGDKYGKVAGGLYNIGAEAGKGGLEAGLDSKSITDGVIKGGIKGTIDTTMSAGLDKLLPPGEVPPGMDWTSANIKTVYNGIKGNNPLSTVSQGAVKDGLINAGKDQLKNLAKGEEIPVIEVKQGFTDAAIKASTPYIKAGARNLGDAFGSVKG